MPIPLGEINCKNKSFSKISDLVDFFKVKSWLILNLFHKEHKTQNSNLGEATSISQLQIRK